MWQNWMTDKMDDLAYIDIGEISDCLVVDPRELARQLNTDLSGLADAGRKAYDSIWRSKSAPRGYCFVRKTIGFSDFDALLIEKNKPKMKMADLYTGLFLLGKLMGDIYSPKRVFSIENSAARSVYFFDAKEVLK